MNYKSIGAAIALWALIGVTPAKAAYDYNISTSTAYYVSDIVVSLDSVNEPGYIGGIPIGPAVANAPHGANYTPGLGTVPGNNSAITVCLDLVGALYMGYNYTFNELPFAGQTGINPAWGKDKSSAAQYQAIQNASAFYAAHQNVTTAKEWAAVQLGVWDLLYNTDSTGNITGNRFGVTSAGSSGAWALTQSWLTGFQRTTDYVGYLLKPTDTTAQELLIAVTPVPEPSAFVAGALLLLPFGLSMFRIVRKNRKLDND